MTGTLVAFCGPPPSNSSASSFLTITTACFAGLVTRALEEFRHAVSRQPATFVQETLGGRLIHPVSIIPRGMGKLLSKKGLLKLKDALELALTDAWQATNSSAHCLSLLEISLALYVAVRPNTMTLFGDGLMTEFMAAHDSSPVESPRGTLIHSYALNSRGFCTEADIITPQPPTRRP